MIKSYFLTTLYFYPKNNKPTYKLHSKFKSSNIPRLTYWS